MPTKSLVEILKEIERVSAYFDLNVQQASRQAFENYRRRNAVVDKVLKKETTFYAQVDAIYQQEAGKFYVPHTVDLPESYKQLQEALGELIGKTRSSVSIKSFCSNPLMSSAIYMVLFGGGANYVMTASTKRFLKQIPADQQKQYAERLGVRMSRRRFMVYGLFWGMGALIGTASSSLRKRGYEQAFNNATYLDQHVKSLYK